MAHKVLLQGLALLGTVGATISAFPSDALALILARTQTQSQDNTATVWDEIFTFDKFDPLEFGGKYLAKVEIELEGNAITTLNLTSDTDPSFAKGNVGADITADFSGLIPDLSLKVLPSAAFGEGTPGDLGLAVPSATGLTVGPLEGDDFDSFSSTESGTLSAFTGTGTFDVDLLALGDLSLSQLGGNVTSSQSTTAGASVVIRYFVDEYPPVPVPEPLSLLPVALVGVGLLRSKR
jgi:hypothetical protein